MNIIQTNKDVDNYITAKLLTLIDEVDFYAALRFEKEDVEKINFDTNDFKITFVTKMFNKDIENYLKHKKILIKDMLMILFNDLKYLYNLSNLIQKEMKNNIDEYKNLLEFEKDIKYDFSHVNVTIKFIDVKNCDKENILKHYNECKEHEKNRLINKFLELKKDNNYYNK